MSAGQGPVRVLVVTPQYLPDLGGIEQHVHATATRIARRGDIALTVLATDRTGNRPVVADGGGFTVRRVRAYPRHRDYYVAPGLGRVIRDGDYDLVHCQGIHTAVPVLAMRAARRAGLPYLVSLHTGGHSSRLRNRLRTAQWRALGPWLRGAAAVVAVSVTRPAPGDCSGTPSAGCSWTSTPKPVVGTAAVPFAAGVRIVAVEAPSAPTVKDDVSAAAVPVVVQPPATVIVTAPGWKAAKAPAAKWKV